MTLGKRQQSRADNVMRCVIHLDVVGVDEEVSLVQVVDDDLLVGVQVLDELLHGHVAVCVCGLYMCIGPLVLVYGGPGSINARKRRHLPCDEDALAREHFGVRAAGSGGVDGLGGCGACSAM